MNERFNTDGTLKNPRPSESGKQNKRGTSRCKSCGFRIRSTGHEEGQHHTGRIGQVRHAVSR